MEELESGRDFRKLLNLIKKDKSLPLIKAEIRIHSRQQAHNIIHRVTIGSNALVMGGFHKIYIHYVLVLPRGELRDCFCFADLSGPPDNERLTLRC